MDRRIASLLASGMLCAASLLLGAGPASGTASHNPIGHVDSVLYDIKYQAIDVAGWAGDPTPELRQFGFTYTWTGGEQPRSERD